jgi:hypothetical protein
MWSRYLALIIRKLGARWRVSGQSHAPAVVTQDKSTTSHCTGDRAGLRTGVDGCGKQENDLPHRGFDLRIFQSVACALYRNERSRSRQNKYEIKDALVQVGMLTF